MSIAVDRKTFSIAGARIKAGQSRTVELHVSETYTGNPVTVPLRIVRGERPGPAVFVTAMVHGDEVNGMGIVRELMLRHESEIEAGTLLLVPVVNVMGFERFSRYLPDRRDLNRSFPGSAKGSLAARFAHSIFEQIVRRCDYGIDLHSAAVRRTNFPNIRADAAQPSVLKLAQDFGAEVIINGQGPEGSLRREACVAGVPTIILEAGEVWKIEPGVVEVGVRGVRNVLIALGMISGRPTPPAFQALIQETMWVRAMEGGILRFHVAPGELVERNQPVATNSDLMGRELISMLSPADGVVLGMTTLPAVKPGDPVCHIAVVERDFAKIQAALRRAPDGHIHRVVREQLATNISITDLLEKAPE